MRRIAQVLVVAALSTGTATAASERIPVSSASTTAAVASLELHDPLGRTSRSVDAAGGVYFRLCDRGSFRPCAIERGAWAARRQAHALARATFARTGTGLVVVGLPQTPTRYALLVFERDVLEADEALAATATRLYDMAGLVACSERRDCLELVRLRAWRVRPAGR
jgi:hypothetical protein